MTQLSSVFIIIAGVITVGIIITKTRTALRLKAEEKQEAHRISIKPSVSFYLKKHESVSTNNEMCIKNTSKGKAVNISIQDFHHPDEKDWCFKFQKINLLDPEEEKVIDFDFFAGAHKAANKTDQLWVFDPDHDHDFASKVVISYFDIEENAYNQTITIGQENKKQSSRKRHLQQIQIAMAQAKRR
ncbi:MAG: hypothetical protein GY707_07670 [Desulfobacteraceae bacterium]|nr:hypothetical protein [Desulfobacteraceae bacterium]